MHQLRLSPLTHTYYAVRQREGRPIRQRGQPQALLRSYASVNPANIVSRIRRQKNMHSCIVNDSTTGAK